MIRTVSLLLLFIVSGTVNGEAKAKIKPWVASVSSNIGSWKTGELDSYGNQALGYTQVAYDSNKWGVAFTGAYSSTSQKTDGYDSSLEIRRFSNAGISTYMLKKSDNLTIRAGIDLGIPMERSSLKTDDLRRMVVDDISEDLMPLNSFAAGFDIGFNLGMVYAANPFTYGLGVKYLLAGEYDPVTDLEDGSFDPGDSVTLVGSALYLLGRGDALIFIGTYQNYEKDKLGGRDIYHNGDRYKAEARYLKHWGSGWKSMFGVIFERQGRNSIQSDFGTTLQSETGNSNGDILETFLSGAFVMSKWIQLTGIAGYKSVQANGLDEENELRDGGRSLYYLEPGIIYYVNRSAYVTVKPRYARIEDKKDAFAVRNANYDVFSVNFEFVSTF